MTDRELLELAAKAAGIEYAHIDGHGAILYSEHPRYWNPLTDDGDALRLAVALLAKIDFHDGGVSVFIEESVQGYFVDIEGDPLAATRRAITRAAAEIGRNMK